jgi:very-short-patch-repair endonuclease
MFRGHAAVGVWLLNRTLPNAIEPDAMEIRKALASREMIVFETTGVTHRPPMTLDHAESFVKRRLDEGQAFDFVTAIDVRRCRSSGITPLASHEPMRESVDDEADTSVVLPIPPVFYTANLPKEIVEEKPTTAATRIDRWQKKLLDLTLRNRLLNFPDRKSSIPFLCTNVPYLEDRLAAGASIRLISLPDQNPLGERDADLYREVRGQDLHRRFAAEALQRDELVSTLDAKSLEARLIDLHRQVRNDFAEGGANTLFLAVGFLRWKKKPEDERTYRAPLLLVPVKLERKSASSRFTLRFHEDEPRFNATLLQFLEHDFNLKLPQFAGSLPLDESGVDVPRLLGLMRQAIRDVPGMEVVDETALSTFSFAKFLMWKDLVERTDALRQNRVVKHLIDNPEKAFEADNGIFRNERELDRHYAPTDIISLLPADSSQIAACLAAAEGRDFVIIGPPGTGKSQTIANMIANCLAVRKTVLFVAEKTAALDVVYRRLREHGLGNHCLELHSSKTDRKSFLGQLKKSWESSSRFDESEWVQINEKLRMQRDRLNAYVDALHRTHANGLSPYVALGTALRGKERHAPVLSWPSRNAHNEASRRHLEEMAVELGRVFQSVQSHPALHLVDSSEWSSAWQESLIAATSELQRKTEEVRRTQDAFRGRIGLPAKSDETLVELQHLLALAGTLRECAGSDQSIMFEADFGQLRSALGELENAISGYRAAETGLSTKFTQDTVQNVPVDELDQQWRQASASLWPKSWLGRRRVKKLLQSYATGGISDPERDLPLLRKMQGYHAAVHKNSLAAKPIGFSGLDTDLTAIDRHLTSATRLHESLLRLGKAAEEMKVVVQAIMPIAGAIAEHDPIWQTATAYSDAFSSFLESATRFATISGVDPLDSTCGALLSNISVRMTEIARARHLLRDWSTWCRVRQQAEAHGLAPLVEGLESGTVHSNEAEAVFKLAYARWWLPPTLDADPVLRDFRRFQHEHAIEDFRQIDDLVRGTTASRVIDALAHGLPSVQSVPRNSELGLLRHQMELQRPNRSIREMIGAMPSSFSKLAPCMLMSPLSIAQYLPPDQALFDVVIFDEASQITTWDAVGAIARAKQTIIVGDPKQLPPTNFFGRNEDEDGAEVVDHEKDLESILDEAKAAGIPVRDLRWHYRSRSESLIAFSNYHYYQNRLITFPSPNVEDRAVKFRSIPNGIYDRGKSRTNQIEARAVAAEAVRRMRAWLTLSEANRLTLGIITFNVQQQKEIQDLLDQARRDDPDLEWFFADERIEPTIVKNLENVQGDERDVMLFSITFTQDAVGKRSMDFGALNRDGGERRLNVAVTRARQELLVFSGFTADQIDTGRTKALGVHHLKAFLDFAERGPIALPAQDQGSKGALESPFEEAVAEALERLGWQIVPQVGVSGFRVDIGVRHPDLAGAYLAGVECDGATYHRSATARDRDKVREQVLRGLGWNIERVWSIDWWFDPNGAIDRLHSNLGGLLAESRRKMAEQPVSEDPVHWDMGDAIAPVDPNTVEPEEPHEIVSVVHGQSEDIENLVAESDEAVDVSSPLISFGLSPTTEVPTESLPSETSRGVGYQVTDLSAIQADPDRFHDFVYRSTLRAMVDAIIECEAPLREDILAQRIARAHGWLRTGNKIRERIMLQLREVDRTSESSGNFVWKLGTVTELLDYRHPRDTDSRRAIPEIPLAELAAFVVGNVDLLGEPDPALGLARLLGVERLAGTSRSRLQEAIERAQIHITVSSNKSGSRS